MTAVYRSKATIDQAARVCTYISKVLDYVIIFDAWTLKGTPGTCRLWPAFIPGSDPALEIMALKSK